MYTAMQKYTYPLKFDSFEKYLDFCEKRKTIKKCKVGKHAIA